MFGKRLAALRKQIGISQYDLADQLGLSRGQLSNYELGTREPDFETLRKITEYFDVTADYLLGFSNKQTEAGSDSALPPSHNNKLPILGTIKSGIPLLADENIDGYLEAPDDIQGDYVLIVKDNSLIGAGILEGDYAICRESEVAESGQIIVALKEIGDGFYTAALKFYIEDNDSAVKYANPHYPEINMTEVYRIAGVLVALIRKEEPGYEAYNKPLPPGEYIDWTEIINLSSQAGLKAQQVKEIILGQIEIARRLKGI